jgi:hypothetical protein
MGFLRGIGEPLTYRSAWSQEHLNVTKAFEEMLNLSVSRLREWVWRWMFFNSNGSGLNEPIVEAFNEIVVKAAAQNITVLGMVQDFPSWMTDIVGDNQAVPYRNLTEGSPYEKFLSKYEESWRVLAGTFPDVTMWEIGNEYNLPDYLHPIGYNKSDYNTWFSCTDTADIVTDLLYYGSKGIHEGKPSARTVMCGLGPSTNDLSNVKDFLNATYLNIRNGKWPSTNASDFFEIACWHPYLLNSSKEPNSTNWVEPNEAIYDVINKTYIDTNRPVIFSEMGFSNNGTNLSEEKVADYMNVTLTLAKKFNWLDTIYWFRLIDPNPIYDQNLGPREYGFGLFDLNWSRKQAAIVYSPEFPSFFILPLFMTATLLAVISHKRKTRRQFHKAYEPIPTRARFMSQGHE